MQKQADERREARPPRSAAFLRFFYGAGLLALGACLGIVIGSLSETPRLLLERLRGPVETVEVPAPASEPRPPDPSAASLERFGELQEGKSPKREKALPAPVEPVPEVEPPPLVPPSELVPAPPVAAAPPAQPSEARATAQPHGPVVQVASYVERKPAEDLVAKLKDSGFDAYVSQPAAANGRFRVRIRPAIGESAGDLATRLRGFGFDTWATSE